MNRLFYSIHKWISAAAFLQLTIWTTTGFLFAVISQTSLKSTPVEGAHAGVVAEAPAVTVAQAIDLAKDAGDIEKLELRATPAGLHYVIKGAKTTVRLDARTGKLAPVEREEAETTARRDQPGSPVVRETTLVKDSPLIEYRDCPLPAFRVVLGDAAGTVVYVDALTGDVSARRNDRWRLYDFIWSLHIMDYGGRENFNHLWIIGFASLAIGTVASGIVLLGIRSVRWLRKRAA